MQALQNILKFLNTQANTPKYLGFYHILWIAIAIAAAVVLCILWKKEIIKNAKKVIFIISLVLLVLGLYRQVVLSFTYDPAIKFAYNWNNFPWHFLSTPLVIGLFVGTTSGKINNHFTSYLATYGLLAGLFGMFQPNVFVSTVGLNIYSMLCYGSMIAIAIFILFSQQVRIEFRTCLKALPVFAMVVGISISLNELAHVFVPHQSISFFSLGRYCTSDAPVYSTLHNVFLRTGGNITTVEYVICILFYFLLVSVVAFIPMALMVGIKKLLSTDFDAEYAKQDALAQGIISSEGIDKGDSPEIFSFTGKVNSSKNTYMKTYFKNLYTNFGNNNKGSCGYVAAAMLLSYYDTALSDKIVPRQFDQPTSSKNEPDLKESPGTKYFFHPEFNPDQMNYKDYVKHVNKTKNDYLHESLLKIAIKKKLVTDSNGNKIENKETFDYNFGSNPEQIKQVLDYYFDHVSEIKDSHYSIEIKRITDPANQEIKNPVTSADIRNYAIEKVKKGYPVWLGISKSYEEGAGHAVIAYDYDEKLDKLYCHFGWIHDYVTEYHTIQKRNKEIVEEIVRAETYTHRTPEDEHEKLGYDLYDCALVLQFNEKKLSHTHTDNYEVAVNGEVFYYCPDGRYTTKDDLIVEFGRGKEVLSIVGVYHKYPNERLVIPEYIGKIEVTNIGKYAFENQEHLKEVVIECPIQTIPKKAFEDCESLRTVSIPGSVEKIGKEAFAECRALTTIIYHGTTEDWYDIDKSSSWDRKTGNYRVHCFDGILFKYADNEHVQLM